MRTRHTILTLTLATTLLASLQTPVALADSDSDQKFTGIGITQALTAVQLVQLTGLEEDNIKGSIKVPFYRDADEMSSKALVSKDQAVAIAIKSGLGKVIKAKLDEEEDYLVWELKILGSHGESYKLFVDAGNAKILYVRVKTKHDED